MSENFADDIDRANHLAEMATNDAVDAVRRRAAAEQDPDNLSIECQDCGEDIEPARLQMLRCRCFKCQTNKELREKQYARP